MAEIKTREKSKGIKALDKAVVAGERMKRAFVRSKDQAENLLDDGQISPSEYAEDKVRYMAEDTAREVGHEAGKLTGKAKSACRSHREAKRTADAAQQDRVSARRRLRRPDAHRTGGRQLRQPCGPPRGRPGLA